MIHRVAATFLIALIPATTAAAQDHEFHGPADVASMTVTAALAEFEGGGGPFVLGGVRGVVPAGRKLAIVAAVPTVFGDAGSAVGNPFIGILVGDAQTTFTGQLGVRLPVASGDADAQLVGVIGNYEQLEAYVPDLMSVSAAVQLDRVEPSGLILRALLEPTVTYLTAEGPGDKTDFLLNYGAQVGFGDRRTEGTAAVTGRALLSGGGASFSERTIHQVTLAGSHSLGQIRPGAFIRLPLDDDLGALLDYVVGVSLAVEL